MSSGLVFDVGSSFKVKGTELEVVTVSSNPDTGVTLYEVCTKADADKRREISESEPAADVDEQDSESATDER